MSEITPISGGDLRSKGLTRIHARIHCAATDGYDGEHSDTDQIMIDHFLQTLAEVALAVASRKVRQYDDEQA